MPSALRCSITAVQDVGEGEIANKAADDVVGLAERDVVVGDEGVGELSGSPQVAVPERGHARQVERAGLDHLRGAGGHSKPSEEQLLLLVQVARGPTVKHGEGQGP